MTNEFEQIEKDNLRRRVKELMSEEFNIIENTIESEDSSYEIAKLSPNADNTTIINKINEFINEFNKTLIDNKI